MSKTITAQGSNISFSGALSGLNFCEVSIGAPGFTIGSIDSTCLANSGYITKLPASLKEIPDINFTAKYLPGDFSAVAAAIGVNNLITFDFDSEGDVQLWGFLASYTPGTGTVNDGWTVDGTITVTNMNNSYAEVAPVYSA